MQKDKKIENSEVDFHGAAIVDENGNETEITESMVQEAIEIIESEIEPDSEPGL